MFTISGGDLNLEKEADKSNTGASLQGGINKYLMDIALDVLIG